MKTKKDEIKITSIPTTPASMEVVRCILLELFKSNLHTGRCVGLNCAAEPGKLRFLLSPLVVSLLCSAPQSGPTERQGPFAINSPSPPVWDTLAYASLHGLLSWRTSQSL